MRINDLNKAVSLLANIGVLGGLLLVAVELNQTNDLMAAQDRYNRLDLHMTNQNNVLANSDIATIIAKSINGEELAPEEEFALAVMSRQILRIMEWTFKELPNNELPILQWRRNLALQPIYELWGREKAEYDTKFVEFMTSDIVDR